MQSVRNVDGRERLEMKPKTRRCPKCNGTMLQFPEQWQCLNASCGYKQDRFIRPDTTMPLFLAVKTRTPEDKKFLEDIMQEPKKPKRSWYYGPSNEIFVRIEGQKHLEVYTQEQWCMILAKEIRQREGLE